MKNEGINKERIVIIGGMPRSGTTFLYHNLQKHPSVFVPYRKELEFFTYYYEKGYDWYLGHFKGMKPDQVSFDIGPKYFLDETVIERIRKFNPHAKIILGVRDPVEFALSWYAQYSTFNLKMPPFEDFIKSYNLQRVNKVLHVHLTEKLIPRMLEKYRNTFGNNLLMFSYDFFKKDPLVVLKSIESFVGIPSYFNEQNFDNVVINAASRKNIKLVAYLLSREKVITMLRILFPARLIRFMRGRFDRGGRQNTGTSMNSYPAEYIRLAEKVFADQRMFVNELFADSGIILGSGKSFDTFIT